MNPTFNYNRTPEQIVEILEDMAERIGREAGHLSDYKYSSVYWQAAQLIRNSKEMTT